MRLYSFTHSYLSDIQRGIQTAHLVGDMCCPKVYSNGIDNKAVEWAMQDKTIIVLNGGNCDSLQNIYYNLNDLTRNKLLRPYQVTLSEFFEDDPSMSGMQTAVGIILPDIVYDIIPYLKSTESPPIKITDPRAYKVCLPLAEYISQFRLA